MPMRGEKVQGEMEGNKGLGRAAIYLGDGMGYLIKRTDEENYLSRQQGKQRKRDVLKNSHGNRGGEKTKAKKVWKARKHPCQRRVLLEKKRQ